MLILKTSVLLFIFWLVMCMAAFVSMRSEVLLLEHSLTTRVSLYCSIVTFVCVVLNLVLAVLTERHVTNFDPKIHSPEFTSSLLSKLTFWWINPYVFNNTKS